MPRITDYLLDKKILIVIIISTIFIITTLGLVFGIKQKEKIPDCNFPECNPCLYSEPTEWSLCNSKKEQYRTIYHTGYKKTSTSGETLAVKCNDIKEKRSCEYISTYILFHDKCELDSIIFQGGINSEYPEVIIPENKKNIKKISLPSYMILNKIGKLVAESDDGKVITITDTPYCLPENFTLKKVKLVSN